MHFMGEKFHVSNIDLLGSIQPNRNKKKRKFQVANPSRIFRRTMHYARRVSCKEACEANPKAWGFAYRPFINFKQSFFVFFFRAQFLDLSFQTNRSFASDSFAMQNSLEIPSRSSKNRITVEQWQLYSALISRGIIVIREKHD